MMWCNVTRGKFSKPKLGNGKDGKWNTVLPILTDPDPIYRSKTLAPPSALLAVPNVTFHPSTASVPITVLLYDGPLLCGFDVLVKG